MAEFSIIEEFCQGIGPNHPETKLGVGDDAAVVDVPKGMELAISVDTMVSGVHFFPDVDPAKLAHKILAVNLSDMAAMGATPKWATMALSIPEFDNFWLKTFTDSLKRVANRFDVQIIGGDTTQGPLNLSITIMGLLPQSKRLCRSGAQPSDDVYVSHTLGDAALGLAVLNGEVKLGMAEQTHVLEALETPEPRVKLGGALLSVASACLDVSDGLIGDLNHIAQQSKVSIDIDSNLVPLSDVYRSYLKTGGKLDLALSGGDDYELVFTAGPEYRETIEDIAIKFGIALTKVGKVVERSLESVKVSNNGTRYTVTDGYQHFS
jgi:thiamine-monophosphate kinase